MTRGIVLPLTAEQIVARALYLAGETSLDTLDDHVRRPFGQPADIPSSVRCPEIFYLLHEHNGGKDPTASDPADRWSTDAELERVRNGGPMAPAPFVNRTCDCIGGASWCSGFDRYQPVRFGHVPGYDGWINTDSMIWEATHTKRCFVDAGRPEPGTMIVCASGSLHHAIGHVGVVVGSKLAEWDPKVAACWSAIEVVNVAAYRDDHGNPARANRRTTGAGWFGTGALFCRSIMVP